MKSGQSEHLSKNIQFLGLYINGEPSHFVLISEDQQTSLALTIIPNPVESIWEGHACIYFEMANKEADTFVMLPAIDTQDGGRAEMIIVRKNQEKVIVPLFGCVETIKNR